MNNEHKIISRVGENAFQCPIGLAMHLIGGKWKTTILWYLRNGCLRFGELRKQMPQISERTLSITLQQLEADGLVSKTVYPSKPPLKVEYALTGLGITLTPVLDTISSWGFELERNYGYRFKAAQQK